MQRRRRGEAAVLAVRIDPNLILELHEHKLTYYSKLDDNSVCDRCHRLCSDEGWRCDKEECGIAIEVCHRIQLQQPFFCIACYSECARLQSECLAMVVSEQARAEILKKSRTPNLRVLWKNEDTLKISNQGEIISFDSLVNAVVKGNLERVKEIVDHSEFSRHIQIDDTLSTPGNPHHYGKTPLLLAAEGGHRSIVTLLLERGANRDVADIRTGLTPLMIASLRGHSSVVDELVHAGVAIDRMSPSGYTATHYAAVNGNAALLRRLIKFGADVLVRTPAGRTPLIISSCNGHVDAVNELLQSMDKESVELPDREGYTALDIAIARENVKVEHVLRRFLAS